MAAKGALATIDKLLWSVAPKAPLEDRRKIAAAIPPLLKAIRTGVAGAGIEAATATAFFTELMKLHAEAMRAPPPAPVKPKRRKAGAPGAASNEPVPKETLTEAHATSALPPPDPSPPAPRAPVPPSDVGDALDFTAPVTLNNPFGEGTVEVSSDDLDFTPDAPVEPAAPIGIEPLPADP